MKDERKTKAQLIEELQELRARVAALEGGHEPADCAETDHLYREMVEHANDIIYTLAPDGTMTYVSPNWTEILGHETSEVINTSFAPFVHPDDVDRCMVFIQSVFETGERQGPIEYRVQHKNGEWRCHVSTAALIDDPDGGKTYMGIAHDITERKQAEEALRESEEKFRSISATAQDAIILMDPQGKISLWNEAAERMFGYSREEALGKNLHALIAPERYMQAFEKGFEAFRQSGEGAAVGRVLELEAARRDGSEFHVELALSTVKLNEQWHATGIIRDITDRKHAEDDLLQARDELEERVKDRTRELEEEVTERVRAEAQTAIFRRLAEASGSGLGMAELDGSTTYLNPAACEMLELDRPEKGYGRHIREFHPEETWKVLEAEALPAVMETGEWNGESALISASGKVTPVIQSLFVLRDEQGTPTKLASVLTDISERKQAEQTIRAEALRMTALFDGINEVIYVSDPDTYEILFANQFLKEAFSKPLIGGVCYKEFQGLDEPCEFCTNSIILKNKGEAHQWEHHNPVVDRSYLVTDKIIRWPDGRDVRFELAIDITERKKAEAAQEKSEQMFRALTESMHAIVFIANIQEQRAIYANKAAIDRTGYSFEELTAETPPPLLDEESQKKQMEYAEAYFRGEEVPERTEFQMITKSGETIWVESSWALIDVEGEGLHKVTTSFDITERKQAEAALRDSERKFRALANGTPAGIAITQDDRFLYANQTILDHYGATWEEFSKLSPHDTLSTPAHDAGKVAMEAALEDDAEQWRFEYQDPSGIWMEVSASRTEIDGKKAMIWTSFDITERKQAIEAIEESERKFRGLAESTTAHITIIQDDRYVYANQAFLDYHGLDADDLAALSPEDMAMGMMAPEDIKQAAPAWEAALQRGDSSFQIEVQDLEGHWFHANTTKMELDGKQSFMSMVFDITEQKKAQEELRRNEEKYRTIFETTGTSMITTDEKAIITLANEVWTNLVGCPMDEMIGKKSWAEFFTEESLAKMKVYHERRNRDPDSAPGSYEAQAIGADGKIHDGIITVNMVPGTTQRVASFQDLTELKRAQHQMYRADKMAALGQIIAGVAHEINNPNNFIYFNIPILRRYVEAVQPLFSKIVEEQPDIKLLNMPYAEFVADVFKLLENMEHGSKRITEIVADLKSYIGGHEEEQKKPSSLESVVNRVMTLVGKQVRKMVKNFGVDVEPDLPAVVMNAGRLEQVLINLIINSGQAADKDDSWVKLTVGTCCADGSVVEIRVEDNGIGIPPESIDNIFDPFFTSKSRDAGTGLGLAISQQIVEDHGGKILVESTPGEGACFTICLPAHAGESQA